MDLQQTRNILEACLLVAGKAMNIGQLESLFDTDDDKPDRTQIREALIALQTEYEGRGIELVEVASGWRLQTRSGMEHWVARLFQEKSPRYSRALLETLVLIAYRQPITRGEIEEVRGVAVSSNIIRTLQEREWVKEVGYKDVPGKPALWGTTRKFLDYFNLKRLDELPTLAEARDLDEIDATLAAEVGLVDGVTDILAANDSDGESTEESTMVSAESSELSREDSAPTSDAIITQELIEEAEKRSNSELIDLGCLSSEADHSEQEKESTESTMGSDLSRLAEQLPGAGDGPAIDLDMKNLARAFVDKDDDDTDQEEPLDISGYGQTGESAGNLAVLGVGIEGDESSVHDQSLIDISVHAPADTVVTEAPERVVESEDVSAHDLIIEERGGKQTAAGSGGGEIKNRDASQKVSPVDVTTADRQAPATPPSTEGDSGNGGAEAELRRVIDEFAAAHQLELAERDQQLGVLKDDVFIDNVSPEVDEEMELSSVSAASATVSISHMDQTHALQGAMAGIADTEVSDVAEVSSAPQSAIAEDPENKFTDP